MSTNDPGTTAASGGHAAAAGSAAPSMTISGTVLRPVIFVVDATAPLPGQQLIDASEEPFDVRRTSIAASELTDESSHAAGGAGSGMNDANVFDSFLAALQGKQPGSETSKDVNAMMLDDDISMADGSFASTAPGPLTPRSPLAGEDLLGSPAAAPPQKRFMSPFARLRKGRWKATSPGVTTGNDEQNEEDSATPAHKAIAEDMENDPDDTTNATHTTDESSTANSADNVSSALSSYSKDNPPVHFMSKRARIVSVSRRHAFPPSKFPRGKMDHTSSVASNSGVMLGEAHISSGSGNWMSSYEVQNEGILPSGWLEKHARALPSALLVVTTLRIGSDENRRIGIKNAVRAVEDLRMTLAEKRSVPIHLVCLMKEQDITASGEDTKSGRGGKPGNQRQINAIREKICQECYLPQSQVFLLKYPTDLVPDEFEAAILRSPYLDKSNAATALQLSPAEIASKIMINPLLRQLDRSLRDTSALYYSRLAEAHERKLMLWRNRYHNTNASFEVNTLMAAMRCARYSMKVGTLREFQMRTGGSGGAGQSGSGSRWTERGSSAMRHYDEAYRWVVELHRRAVAWRVASLSATPTGAAASQQASFGPSSYPSPAPITPGGKNLYSMDDINSPNFTESPGGGIGVELSFPGGAPPPPSMTGATPPPPPAPPMRRNSPALTSKKGYSTAENIAFFALLWEQCRAVASILNAKLLRSTNSGGANNNGMGNEAEEQWSRHRLLFLATPQSIPQFNPAMNDDFFGPAWHRFLYATEELLTFACIAEGRWRRTLNHAAKSNTTLKALSSSFHQAAAPWKAYSELSEAMLGLRKVVKQQLNGYESSGWGILSSGSGGRQKFVGSIVSGDSGYGTMGWQFENESKRDHRAMALDFVLHGLDLLDENTSICSGDDSDTTQQPSASARMHYLAARLLMSLDNPEGAKVHLNIAAEHTKSWPSLLISIQRAIFACEERCAASKESLHAHGSASIPGGYPEARKILPNDQSKDSSIELLLRPASCKLLSSEEMEDAQTKAWRNDSAVGMDSPPREIVWNHDDTSKALPPFEFAVSFLKSTHATSSDTVTACISVKSCLDFQVCVESLQLLTTSGTYDVTNLGQCVGKKALLQSLNGEGNVGEDGASAQYIQNQGVHFSSNDLAFFMQEFTLPSNLSDIAFGGSSADLSKFIPKNGRLCNMGLTHAAGSICESRFAVGDGQQHKISINGKPIATSSLSEEASSFLGGIPFVCRGLALTLKQPGNDSSSSLKLRVETPRLVSPLLRSGTQSLVMEESNYIAHSWSRPRHHPWSLGPRVLRVLGPRPHMHVTNLTESMTGSNAVEGTVNRIMLRLSAGNDEDCWDVRVRLKCKSSMKQQSNTSTSGTPAEEAATAIAPQLVPIFVKKAPDSTAKTVTQNGAALPEGWEVRTDVGTDESHDESTAVCTHLEAGKSALLPLDIFRPLDQSSGGNSICSTSYEVIIMYRQVRSGKGATGQGEPGDQVMIMQGGSVDWIPPFAAEFSLTNGSKKPFPCGILHASNSVAEGDPSSTTEGSETIAANGEQVHMRCSLQARGVGSKVAASIQRVTNQDGLNGSPEELYSAESGLFMNQTKQGSKLSLSYSVSAKNDSGKETIPLGTICVEWKPESLALPDTVSTDKIALPDEFGLIHGPLSLSKLPPMIFHGPQCKVLNAPFKAKLLKCPSTPKVGTPFSISYQVTNQTAKSQTLGLSLKDFHDDKQPGPANQQLLGAGKLKEEVELAPFEEKTFSFTFISMTAGRVLRPPLMISSGRHKTWVIKETNNSARYLFVMP